MNLADFAQSVRDDFRECGLDYLTEVQQLVPEVKILGVQLTGSFAPGHMPTEESDVDMEVMYRGELTEDDVTSRLRGRVNGYGGVFDIVPVQLESADDAEVSMIRAALSAIAKGMDVDESLGLFFFD